MTPPPSVASLNSVIPVPEMSEAVDFWSSLLGVEPTFVDDDRWAQFDVEGKRLSLAGTDRMTEYPTVMIKVEDLDAAISSLEDAGAKVSELGDGSHERRCRVATPGGWDVILYSSS